HHPELHSFPTRRSSDLKHIIPIACNAWHSPWGIAFNEAQRLAIEADPTWKENEHRAGSEGLKAARAIGMISYRHYEIFAQTQAEDRKSTRLNSSHVKIS